MIFFFDSLSRGRKVAKPTCYMLYFKLSFKAKHKALKLHVQLFFFWLLKLVCVSPVFQCAGPDRRQWRVREGKCVVSLQLFPLCLVRRDKTALGRAWIKTCVCSPLWSAPHGTQPLIQSGRVTERTRGMRSAAVKHFEAVASGNRGGLNSARPGKGGERHRKRENFQFIDL